MSDSASTTDSVDVTGRGDTGLVRPVIRTNVLAIVSIVAAFVVPVAAIITGFLSLSQIRRTGEEGSGLAKAGIIVGFVFSAGVAAFFVVWLSLFVTLLNGGTIN